MSLNDELFAAIEELDIAKVSDLINEGADPDARDIALPIIVKTR